MSQSDYDYLRMTGELPPTNETFISPTESFSSNYNGVTVRFEVNNGTTNSLFEIGVGNNSKQSIKDYGILPKVKKGWNINNAYFKGERSQTNIVTEGEKKYIHLNGEKYFVKAVYKDFTYDHDDYRIVIPWKNLNKKKKDYYINIFRDRIMDMLGLGIDIESDEDVNDELIFINNLYKKNNLILDIDHSPDDEKTFLIHSGTGIIMIIFSMFNTLVVTSMWIIRRRKELMIKKAWGMSEGMIFIRTFFELSRHLIASIPVMVLFQIVYMLIFKESVTFNLYKYAYLILGIIIILLLVSYAALLRIRKLKPAEGLRGE